MTMLQLDGFDDGLFSAKWSATNGVWTSTAARNGSGRRKTSGGGISYFRRFFSNSEEHATIIVGAAINLSSLPAAANPARGVLCDWRSDSDTTQHVSFGFNNVGRVQFFRGAFGTGTLIGESDTGVIQATKWNYIEMLVTLSDASGIVECHVNGTEVINETSLDTKNGGTKTVFDTWGASADQSDIHDPLWDDLYVFNGAGSLNNDFVGDSVVEPLNPDGNGNYSDHVGSDGNSTDNYLLVDDAPNPDDDTTYVEAGTALDKDSYTFENMTAESAATVHGVQISHHVRHTGAGGTFRALHRRSSTDDFGDTVTPASSFTTERYVWEEDPQAGPGAWTVTNVDGSEFGQEIVS